MGLRGLWANPMLSRKQRDPKPRVTHRYRCRWCHRAFTTNRSHAMFCSAGCRQANYRRRRALTTPV
jgi:hypothetical protein